MLPHRYGSEQEKSAFVRKLFDAGAPFYDGVTGWGFMGTGKAYRRMAQNRAGVGPGKVVLDCAAGTGVMAAAAMDLGVKREDILCVDVSPGMLEVAKQKHGVETLVATVDDLPLEDAQYRFCNHGLCSEACEKPGDDICRVFSGAETGWPGADTRDHDTTQGVCPRLLSSVLP